MVQGYYTLEESAQALGMSPDELKQLARKGEIRSFQDRGTWRFRIQDIQEMVRRRSDGSDMELPTSVPPPPGPTDSPVPRSPKPRKQAEDVFSFALGGDETEEPGLRLDEEINLDKPSGSGSGSGKKASSAKRRIQDGSDSDVRLVADDGDIIVPKSGPKSSKTGMGSPRSPRPVKSRMPDQPDSGVRLVPIDSDSDVRITGNESDEIQIPIGEAPPKGATDSDIRLESLVTPGHGGTKEGPLTEEINLDEELKKEESRRKSKLGGPKPKQRHKEEPEKAPFELPDLEMESAPAEEPGIPLLDDSSSDFELTPASESSSPLELGSSDDFRLDVPDDIALSQEEVPAHQGPASGINLDHPDDAGISLEQQSDSSSEEAYELTLQEDEPAPHSPRPSTPKPAHSQLVESEDSDSSEFELSLDVDQNAGPPDSDSEFELTLDDTGGLAEVEEEPTDEAQEKDIFESDFEVPALDEESGSDAVEVEDVDTDLENPDFDIAIDEEGIVGDDSGSEVMALDEEAPPTVETSRLRKKKKKADDDFEDIDEIADDVGLEEEAQVQTVVQQHAPWGVLPVAVLFPCVIVMVLLGMMGFELVQTQQGYKPGMLTKAIGGLMGKK